MKAAMKLMPLFLLFLVSMFSTRAFSGEDWFEQGLSALRSQHHEEAIKAFSKSIETNPKRVEAYNNRGIAWFKKGDYDRALADYGKALGIDPRCAEVYNNRGAIWFYKGEYDLAIDDYDRALGINPHSAKAYNNRGAAWFCKGDRNLAISDYNRALEINPNAVETSKQRAWILAAYSGNAKKNDSKTAGLAQEDVGYKPESDTLGAPFRGVVKSEPNPIRSSKEKNPATRIEDMASGERAESENYVNGRLHHDVTKGAKASSQKTYSVQVGAFFSKEKAEKLTALLKGRGYRARLLPRISWSKKIWYTVRIGDYKTRQAAVEEAEAFSEKEGMPSTVRPFGGL